MKQTITTITLALVLTFGATFANAGIIIGDQNTSGCTGKDGIIIGDIVQQIVGIIIGDLATPPNQVPCTQTDKDGIIIGD